MDQIQDLKKELEKIKARNKKVEADKAWETSWTRRLFLFLFTYIIIVIFFYMANLPDPFKNAVVPSLAFVISTMTLPIVKKWWLKKYES